MNKSTGCKKGVQQGFYQHICGNKYSGKLFICKDCKLKRAKESREEQEELEAKLSSGLILTNDECVVLVASYIELESVSELTDKESALYNKVKEHITKEL